jgi:hypothetical protein
MSDTNKKFAAGTFDIATGTTTVYTVNTAAGSYAFLKSVLIANNGTGSCTYTILLNGSEFPKSATLTITDKMIAIPYLDVVLSAGSTIGGYYNSSNSTVNYYFSGREIVL